MLTPYPLEPPPALPPLDDDWEAPGELLQVGRRALWDEDRVYFFEAVELDRLDLLGPLQVRDRRIVALEEPLFIWDVEAQGPFQLRAEVRFATRRVRYERSREGDRLWLGVEGGKEELLISCYGGKLKVREEGGALRLTATGQGRLRLAFVAAWHEADRDKTLRSLSRKGVSGVVAQFLRHREMVQALGARITTPEPDSVARCELEKLDFESTLREWADGRRALLEPREYGSALLALGLREPVRDTLRGPCADPPVLRLFGAYARWAGVDDFVQRHWPRVAAALRAVVLRSRLLPEYDELRDAADELAAVAEAVGDHEMVEVCGQLIAGVEDFPQSVRAWEFPERFVERWGIFPGALEGMVTLAPELPAEWPEMTFERLRVGSTSLDVRVKRRPTGIAVKVRVTRGPPIVVLLAPRLDFVPTGILMDGAQLPGPTVRFTAEGEVEAVWTR